MRKSTKGFTLIELMIVVSVIGILASLAIPGYERMLLRAKRAELPLNLDGIRLSEQSYHHEWGYYTACVLAPAQIPGRNRAPFPATFTTNLDWNMLGWLPEGQIYGQYEVQTNGANGLTADLTASGFGDIDGDGNYAHFLANKASKPFMATPTNVY